MKTIIIQNQDRNVSRRDYNDTNGGLRVTSVFNTIQGEGPYSGWPAMFLRLAGCNYGSKSDFCRFCDTSFQLDQSTLYSVDELVDLLTKHPSYNPKQILVVTGGEPTLQENLLALLTQIDGAFAKVQIETNGTQPKFFDLAAERHLHIHKLFEAVVSPKANMRLGKYPSLTPSVLWWANCLKFVLSADPENPHHEVPEWALAAHKVIFVSPMAVYKKAYQGEVSSIWDDELIDRERTAANYAYSAKYAMKHNLRLSLQTHLFVALP